MFGHELQLLATSKASLQAVAYTHTLAQAAAPAARTSAAALQHTTQIPNTQPAAGVVTSTRLPACHQAVWGAADSSDESGAAVNFGCVYCRYTL
jgi:hypothetical protein